MTLADMSSDTVYTYSAERVLTPAFVRTPSVHASEPRTVWTTELVSEKFIVFQISTLDFDSAQKGTGFSQRSLMYDYAAGQVVEPSFVDVNNPSASWSPQTGQTPVGTAVEMLNPLRLVEAQEKGELSGPLAEIATSIKEDDNPVVMIVKFKR
jgi:hypothetical protein